MRGRSLTTELLPFGFDEFLLHGGHAVPDRWPVPAGARSRLEHEIDRFIDVGGFPEVQRVSAEIRVRILQDYVDVALLRDVVERHGATNIAALRWLVRRLVASPATRFSVHKLYNEMRSQGIRIGKDLLHEYMGHLEDACLIYTVPIATRSAKVRMVNPKKVYLADHGLARAWSFEARGDTGRLLENAVYLELRRRGFEVAYVGTESGYEVDFLARHATREPLLVQVCADTRAPETSRRETRALEEALRVHRRASAVVVTLREEGQLDVGGREVPVVPAWRWLLEGIAH
jgi:hypothetical protein